jgi:Raf kinase inhibitor-like YbhB/YbcL family protein
MSYDPYALVFPAAPFCLFSDDVAEGGALPVACYAAAPGQNESPQLSWSDLPGGTQSLVLTAFDPDAPIPGGLWHWLVKDIPATTISLPRNAGAPTGPGTGTANGLPGGAVHLANDLGQQAYSGVQPPPGTGTHRLIVCATALSVPALTLPPAASPALLHIMMIEFTLGRALLTGTSRPQS